MAAFWILTGAWRLRRGRSSSRLVNRATGAGFELEGEAVDALAAALRRAQRPVREEELLEPLAPVREAAEVFALLREARVVRRHLRPERPLTIEGRGALADEARRAAAEGGWRLATLCFGARPARPDGGRGVSVFALAGSLWACRSDGAPCPRCLQLRVLGPLAAGGHEQSRALTGEEPLGGRARRGALMAELLACLQESEALEPGEALRVGAGSDGARHRFLPHCDCGSCSEPPLGRAEAVKRFQRALKAAPRRPAPGYREALTEPLLGPLFVESKPGRRGHYPLDAPFVWGSVRLTRLRGKRAISLSTHGGLYGKGDSAQECELLALSEGVERLATLSVRPQLRARADLLEACVRPSLIFPGAGAAADRRERAVVWGIELVSGREVAVPFEAVAVGYPRCFYPEACYREPFYSGAASHRTLPQALVHATLELIKRDALMISWYRGRALPRVRWPRRPRPLARRRADYLQRRHIELELFDLRLELPLPTLLLRATARRTRGNWPAGGSILFASCGFTAEQALDQALGLACGQFVSFALEAGPEKDPLDRAAVDRMSRRAGTGGWRLLTRYLDPRRRAAHDFLGAGAPLPFEALEGREPENPAKAMQTLRRWFAERDLQWIGVRLTDPIAEGAGLEVAKVVVPGFLRLTPSRSSVDFALPRLHRPWPLATSRSPRREPHPLY